jgi:predicted Rossmann fold flavoprotein
MSNIIYDVIVIGGGAAGLMAAIEVGKRGKKVVILEHNSQVGNKILISGGGRCNFTNIYANPENYISNNPHFIHSAFSEYTPKDFIELVEKYKIEYYEKKLGQLFCKKSSKEIINMLLNEASINNVEVRTDTLVKDVNYRNEVFEIETNSGYLLSKNCVIACGGLSFPKKGATDLGYRIAKKFNHKIIETHPALVPFELSQSEMKKLSDLSGISFDTNVRLEINSNNKIKNKKINFNENVLITHRGLSGPAILQISSYWKKGDDIKISIEPNKNIEEILEKNQNSNKELKTILIELVSNRFADYLCNEMKLNKPINQLSKKDKTLIIETINNFKFRPIGTEGYAKAEVTIGGVDTIELNQKTMESKKQKGLYFIGEVVDVTGWLGGYNFQWAWASGYICGKNIT